MTDAHRIADLEARIARLEAVPPDPAPEAFSGRRKRNIQAMRVIAFDVAISHKCTVADIRGPRRWPKYCMARDELCYELHKAGFSLEVIGEYLGGRDRTTIGVAKKRHEMRNPDQ